MTREITVVDRGFGRIMGYALRLSIIAVFTAIVCGCGENPQIADKVQKDKLAARGTDEGANIDAWVLNEAKIGTEAEKLIEYLEQHSGSDEDLLHVDRLIHQLGNTDPAKQEEASGKLTGLGLVVLAPLRAAIHDTNKEIRRRAKECITRIEKDSDTNVPLAAIRIIAQRNAPHAIDVLVRYLPFTSDELVEEEIYYGLDSLARKEGKVNGPLAEALRDPLPARRAVAGCIVGRIGNSKQKRLVQELLSDEDTGVRLRSAQGLLAGGEKESIPTLIRLLEDGSVAVSWQAEELLHYVAGDGAPEETVGAASPESRRKCRESWNAWWKQTGPTLDLATSKKGRPSPRLMFVVDGSYGMNTYHVWLCGSDGKPRWQIKDVEKPTDIQFLATGHVLMGEQVDLRRWQKDNAGRTVERDLDGSILWERNVRSVPITCRRLPSGDTLIADRRCLTTIAPTGEVRLSYLIDTVCEGWIARVCRDSRGIIASTFESASEERSAVIRDVRVTSRRMIREIPLEERFADDHDPQFDKDAVDGHYLLMRVADEELLEVAASGKTVSRRPMPCGCQVTRLPNGNTLVVCDSKGGNRVLEYNAAGDVEWETSTPTFARGAYPCFSIVRLGFGRNR
jgi:hypothetical protein